MLVWQQRDFLLKASQRAERGLVSTITVPVGSNTPNGKRETGATREERPVQATDGPARRGGQGAFVQEVTVCFIYLLSYLILNTPCSVSQYPRLFLDKRRELGRRRTRAAGGSVAPCPAVSAPDTSFSRENRRQCMWPTPSLPLEPLRLARGGCASGQPGAAGVCGSDRQGSPRKTQPQPPGPAGPSLGVRSAIPAQLAASGAGCAPQAPGGGRGGTSTGNRHEPQGVCAA